MLNIVLNYFYVCFFLISTTWLKNELEFASEVLLVKRIVLTLRKTPRQVPYLFLVLKYTDYANICTKICNMSYSCSK